MIQKIIVFVLSVGLSFSVHAETQCAESHVMRNQDVMSWEEICKKNKDAVVRITAYTHDCNILEPYKAPTQGVGTGTGFFINGNGRLLTNFHVVRDSVAVFIEISSLGKERFEIVPLKLYPGHDVAEYQLTDEALARVKKLLGVDELTYCQLGDSDQLNEAQEIMTLGYPLGFEGKVSMGIIAGRESLEMELIQTTAPINPGNSGGPFFNKKGEVVGICVAKILSAEGIAYLIPINNVLVLQKETSDDLIVRNPYWGISLIPSSIDNLQYFGVPYDDRGVRVAEVKKGSLGEEYGIKAGDYILGINGIKVDRFGYLNVEWTKDKVNIEDFLSRLEIGSSVVGSIFRDGEIIDIACEVKSTRNFNIELYFPWHDAPLSYEVIAGMVFVQLTVNHLEFYQEFAKRFNVDTSLITKYKDDNNRLEPRVVISMVHQTSKLHKVRCFREGDRIVKAVNGQPVKTIEDLREAIKMGAEKKYLTVECEGGSFAAFPIKDILEEENILPMRYGYERSALVDFLAQGQ